MLLIVMCVCICVCLYVGTCRRYIPPVNRKVPVQPGWLPVIGHAHKWLGREAIFDFLLSGCKFSYENGGISIAFIGPYPVYVVVDPDDALTVLQKCLDKVVVYKLIEPILGKMLIAAEVPVWKRNRRILDLSFKQKLLDAYLDVFNEGADRLVHTLEEYVGQGAVDVSEKINRSFLETTCRTTMGLSVDGKDHVNDNYAEAISTIMEIITLKFLKPWYLLQSIFNLSSYQKKMETATNKFFSLSEKMIKSRKEEHLQRLKNKQDLDFEGNRFCSYLDILIEKSITQTSSTITDLELRNLIDNVLLATFDTTISEMVLFLVCLGSHLDVQEKIYQEILTVLGETGQVSKENVNLLVYLEAAIKESIRLYPIAILIGRQALTDVELRNVTLPAGSSIAIHLWAVNRNPKYWGEDADEFKPERWLGDSLPEHPAAFASFSPGRRGCPGKQYTLMFFKATAVPLIRKYKFTADHTKLKLEFNILLKPHSGHHIKIEHR